MTPKMILGLREALQHSGGKPVEIEDTQTHEIYVLMTRDDFQRLMYDDSELSEGEMLAAARQGLSDPEGWSAPGMEVYDRDPSRESDS